MTEFIGKTIKGDGRGKTLGFPTINLFIENTTDTSELLINSGVFIVELTLKNKNLIGLLHLGSRPTFNEPEFRIEIFVLENLSHIANSKNTTTKNILQEIQINSEVAFTIVYKIREVIKFDSSEKLVQQIEKDVQTAEIFYVKKNS